MRKTIDFGGVADLYDIYVQWDVDVPFFRQRCADARGEVLELMCGTGRLSLPLLRDGIRLTCVDYSAEMLRVFRERLAAERLAADVHEQDVRALDLDRRFALILLPFHSFSEIVEPADRARALAAIRRHLARGGRVVATFHNPAVQAPRLDGVRRELCDRPIPGRDARLRVWSTATRAADGAVGEARQEYESIGADGRVRETRALRLRFALADAATVEREVATAGFHPLRVWGDYSRAPFDPERSPYMIWELGARMD